MKSGTTLLALSLMVGGCAAGTQMHASAPAAVGTQCAGLQDIDREVAALYAPGNVERVQPLYHTEFFARAIQHRSVAGAELYVPAQRGMNDAYVERMLSCHAASGANVHPNDPLRVANVRGVDVKSVGPRLVISITGADRQSGKEILERARALHGESTQVDVRQLSASPDEAAKL
jgi:hypothetical protein